MWLRLAFGLVMRNMARLITSLGLARVAPVEIPPKPGEFLSSRSGWVVSNSRVDMVTVQSWLVHVQMTVWSHVHSN